MDTILYAIIVILVIGIITLLVKGRRRDRGWAQEEQTMMARLHQKEISERERIEAELQAEREKVYNEKLKLQQELTQEQERLKSFQTEGYTSIALELESHRQLEIEKIKTSLVEIDCLEKQKLEFQMQLDKELYNIAKIELDVQIEKVKGDLENLLAKRHNTLNVIKEEEKIKNEKDFYRILIKPDDADDIVQLKLVEKKINNKDILRKLIYKTYVEPPMLEMFNRINIKETSGIYKIMNINNSMVYIGQSTNIKNRVKAHIQASLGISTIASQVVHDKMSEEGLENFVFQVIEECPKDKLNDREKYYINYYDSNSWGYNKTGGGARTS